MKMNVLYAIGILVNLCLMIMMIFMLVRTCIVEGKFSKADDIYATKAEVEFIRGNVDGNNELFKQIVGKGLKG